jgi:hypothetical protein
MLFPNIKNLLSAFGESTTLFIGACGLGRDSTQTQNKELDGRINQ